MSHSGIHRIQGGVRIPRRGCRVLRAVLPVKEVKPREVASPRSGAAGCYNPDMSSQGLGDQTRSGTSAAPTRSVAAAERARARQVRTAVIAAAFAGVILIAILSLAVYILLQPGTPTERWRDIFIIMVSLESLVIGIALVVLLIQMASLINLLQNEVRPILEATSETVNNLRGTAEFLGESVVEPVIKLNGYLASLRRVLELLGIKQR